MLPCGNNPFTQGSSSANQPTMASEQAGCPSFTEDTSNQYQIEETPIAYGQWYSNPGEVDHPTNDGRGSELFPDPATMGATPASGSPCEYEGCRRTPQYGPRNGPTIFCKDHKKVGMFTIRGGQLLQVTRDGPDRRSRFEEEAPGPATAINDTAEDNPSPSDHAAQGVPNVRRGVAGIIRRRCQTAGCTVRPSYGLKGGNKKPIFCGSHKEPGMVPVKRQPCLYPGCTTLPHFGISGGRPVYCSKHMKPGMLNVLRDVDSKAKKGGATRKTVAMNISAKQKKAPANRKTAPTKDKVIHANEKSMPSNNKKTPTQDKKKQPAKGKESPMKECEVWGGETEDNVPAVPPPRTAPKRGTKLGRQKQGVLEMEIASEGGSARKRAEKGYGKAIALAAPSIVVACKLSRVQVAGKEKAKQKRKSPATPSSELGPIFPSGEVHSTGHKAATTSLVPAEVSQSSRLAGMADASVETPSEEIRILQAARESARAAAEASGSGRRARVPSIKALEAAGMAEVEGAQWMSRKRQQNEKWKQRDNKETVRESTELKKRLKVESAAKIAAGRMLSAPEIDGHGNRKCVVKYGMYSEFETGTASDQSSLVGIQQTQTGGTEQYQGTDTHVTGVATTMVEGVESVKITGDESSASGIFSKRSAPATANKTPPGISSGKRLKTARNRMQGNGIEVQSGEVQQTAKAALMQMGESQNILKTLCQFGDCPKIASYGINGTVRYCGAHRIFGMYKIAAHND